MGIRDRIFFVKGKGMGLIPPPSVRKREGGGINDLINTYHPYHPYLHLEALADTPVSFQVSQPPEPLL